MCNMMPVKKNLKVRLSLLKFMLGTKFSVEIDVYNLANVFEVFQVLLM